MIKFKVLWLLMERFERSHHAQIQYKIVLSKNLFLFISKSQ